MTRRISRSKAPTRSPRPAAPAPAPPTRPSRGPARRPAAPAPSLQRARSLGHRVVQAKLTLGPADDPYERQADDTARQVMQDISSGAAAEPAVEADPGTGSSAQRADDLEDEALDLKRVQRDDLEEETLDMKRVQRDDLEDETLDMKRVQRDGLAAGGALDTGVEQSIDSARSGGRALDDGIRGRMEPAFGADFSAVKVHDDAGAHQLNDSLQARAFTTGSDIFFRSGEYSPGSSSGQELIAHELTHVVQQGAAQARRDD